MLSRDFEIIIEIEGWMNYYLTSQSAMSYDRRWAVVGRWVDEARRACHALKLCPQVLFVRCEKDAQSIRACEYNRDSWMFSDYSGSTCTWRERVPYLVFNCVILRHGGQVLDGVVSDQTIPSVLTRNLDPSSGSLICIPKKTRNKFNHAKNFTHHKVILWKSMRQKEGKTLVTLISLVTLHYLAGYRHLRARCWYSRVDYNAKIPDQTTLVSFQPFITIHKPPGWMPSKFMNDIAFSLTVE